MNLNELRTGNFICTSCGNVGRVSLITYNYVHAIVTSEITRSQDEIFPIPLTADWLRQFGFRRNGSLYYKNDFDLCLNTDYPCSTYFFNTDKYCIEIRHIHQLQNLVYALTNEELTYENLP